MNPAALSEPDTTQQGLPTDLEAFVLGVACGLTLYAVAHHLLREEPQPVSTATNDIGQKKSDALPVEDNVETGPAEHDSRTLKAAVAWPDMAADHVRPRWRHVA